MNFTREPIIETVITPREGCKLVIRSSKGNGQEDYFVDAVEVVSFGHSFFFRSQERPRAFLVPVSDYEVLELKETRMVLKTGNSDRSNIKISGGRTPEPSREPREPREPRGESRGEPRDEVLTDSRPAERPLSKRDRRRRGRRGRDRDRYEQQPQNEPQEHPEPREENFPTPEEHQPEERDFRPEDRVPESSAGGEEGGEERKAPSFISKLFPPPPTLIKESLSRYKPSEEEKTSEENIFEHPDKESEDDNEE